MITAFLMHFVVFLCCVLISYKAKVGRFCLGVFSLLPFYYFTSDLKMERKALEELEKFGISRVKNLECWDKLGFEVR